MAVRITNGTTNRTYLKNLNGSQKAMNRAMERVETGRDFQRVSDNVTKATRAISVRERLYRNEQMTDNVNTAMEQLNMAESALKQMNDICSNVQSEMFKALNTPTLQAGKDSFSAFLDGAKDEIMRLANTKYNDKYVLGGVGIDVAPFKPNEEGDMEFNGVNLSEIMDKSQMLDSLKEKTDLVTGGIIDLNTTEITYCTECENLDTCTHDEPYQLVDYDTFKEYSEYNVLDGSYHSTGLGLDSIMQHFGTDDPSKIHFLIAGGPDTDCYDQTSGGFSYCYTEHLANYATKTITTAGSNNGVNYEVKKEQINHSPENYYTDGNPVKYSSDSYMDIGLDISVSGNGKVASKTAFKTTVDGIAAMGYGKTTVSYDDIKGLQASAGYQGSGSGSSDSETVCNNIYDMMNEMQKAIDSLDDGADISNVIDKISAVMVNFKKQTDNIIAAESEIGVRTQFLETNLDRLEAENTSLKKMQKDIETVDDATEITNFMSYQNAWNLVLQFGKNIVPKSLMDYVN